MKAAAARLWGPVAGALLVACVWLNQGVADVPGVRDAGVSSATAATWVGAARRPLVVLYRRGWDVRLYHELASMMLGQPADADFVLRQRGSLSAPLTSAAFPPPADGRWHAPYAEVPLEYPVLVVPFLVLPRLLAPGLDAYGFLFGALMALCLVGAAVATLDAARAVGVDVAGLRTRAWLASGLLLAEGTIAVQRLDAVTALCIALALRAAAKRQPVALGIWAGLATATKILPALLLPALLAADASFWRERRALPRLATAFALAAVAGFLPMLLFSGHALADVLRYHAQRGLQCESTLGILLGAVRCATRSAVPTALSYGSDNLPGHVADVLAALCGPLTMAGSLALAWAIGRRSLGAAVDDGQGPARVAGAAFAALVVLWLTGKVFSAQYLTWGLPVVLAIPGRSGVRTAWLLLAAMAATQLYLCGHYELVREGSPLGLLNVGLRQALLAAAGYLAARGVVRSIPLPSPAASGRRLPYAPELP